MYTQTGETRIKNYMINFLQGPQSAETLLID